jgi:hypothetical protein
LEHLWNINVEVTDIPSLSRQVSWIYFAETNVQAGYSIVRVSVSMKNPGTVFYYGEEIEVS